MINFDYKTSQKLFFFSIIIIFMLSSCSSTKNTIVYPITISTTACLIRCPEYKAVLNADGTILFEGISNTRIAEKSTIQLSSKQFKKLQTSFLAINWEEEKKEFDLGLYDASKTIVSYNHKKISYKRSESIAKEVAIFIELFTKILKENALLY